MGRAKRNAEREASRDLAAREVKTWHAWGPERPPRAAGQAVVEDALEGRPCLSGEALTTSALEAAVSSLRKRLANAAAGPRVETKRGIGYRLVVGGGP